MTSATIGESSAPNSPKGLRSYQAPREWRVRAELPHSDRELQTLISALSSQTGLSPITLRVCLMRGLTSSEAIQEHLHPKFESITPPFRIRDMDRATERLGKARTSGERVRVFGDYDVDGTTGAALLSWIFRDFGFSFDATQPDRFKDGYGLNVRAVETAANDGVKVLVTVDCGITSFDAAAKARELGIDLIIVDHHQLDAGRGLPEAFAVLNPHRPDCESGLKQLCGCGLAFYLAMALRIHGREQGWWAGAAEPNLKSHLDLVVMATAADMVPLTGDNHILVRHGLEVLKNSKKPGVRALLQAAGVAFKELSPGHLGFVIGPRINASGRMQSASLALELLTTLDSARATQLANELEGLNRERGELQNQIWDEVRARVEAGIAQGKFKNGIVVADPAWHEGVVGIVASRVTETFRRPAAVIALREDFGKGSVRTWGGKDVLSALRSSSKYLRGFGGHRHAAGLTVDPENLDQFTEAFDHALGELSEDVDAAPLLIEGDCSIEDLNVNTLCEIEKLGPFGPGNPEPVFRIKATVQNHRILKERHLKLNLKPLAFQFPGAAEPSAPQARGASRPITIEAIWFHGAEHHEMASGALLTSSAEWAGVPELNRFRGSVTPSFRVRDWKRIEE